MGPGGGVDGDEGQVVGCVVVGARLAAWVRGGERVDSRGQGWWEAAGVCSWREARRSTVYRSNQLLPVDLIKDFKA